MVLPASDIVSFWSWLGLAVVVMLLTLPILVWAIRSGQFGSQKHAAGLPLSAGRKPQGGAQ
jgi:nitrogen fixation-related uncharacterized protein